MLAEQIFALGLGLTPPWKVTSQRLDTTHTPTKLHLEIGTDRGALYPCPECGAMCKAHDFKEYTWWHLNIFQHHCYLTARVPRINCSEHGIRRVDAPWTRKGSRFILLFEQVVMSLVREMPVSVFVRHACVTGKRLWRIVYHYDSKAIKTLDLKDLKAIGLDETASKRGHNYIPVFIDLDRSDKPVIFATPGKGKECLTKFCEFIKAHKGHPENIAEVVCDMSPALLSAVEKEFQSASVMVDWFHVAHLITHFLKHTTEYTADCPLLEPARSALASFVRLIPRILHRWDSLHIIKCSKTSTACFKRQGQGSRLPQPGELYHHSLDFHA